MLLALTMLRLAAAPMPGLVVQTAPVAAPGSVPVDAPDGGARTDPQDDANRIPATTDDAMAPKRVSGLFMSVTQAPQLRLLRSTLAVPLPQETSGDHDVLDRMFVDLRVSPGITPSLQLSLSARLNAIVPLTGRYGDNHVRLDLREAFGSWSPSPAVIIEAGRINIRTGTAAAFNPTDFFRDRTVVDIVSVDPSVQRVNRLGVVIAKATVTSGAAAATLTLVPKLAKREPVSSAHRSFADFRLGRTNAVNAAELRGALDLSDGTSLQFSTLVRDGEAPTVGFNAVRGIGDSATVFVEAALRRTADVVSEAVGDGVTAGELPAAAINLTAASARRYRQSFAVGMTYTTSSKLTLTLEYDHDGAGLNRTQWNGLISNVNASLSPLLGRSTFWYARSLIQQQQQLVTRDQFFARVGWDDAFGCKDLAVSTLALLPTIDRSLLAQSAVDYKLSDRWSFGGLVQIGAGSSRSVFGGTSQSAGAQIYGTRFF